MSKPNSKASENITDNEDDILRRFERDVDKYLKIIQGPNVNSMTTDRDTRLRWSDVYRRSAIKMGNRYQKFTGQYPPDWDVVQKSNMDNLVSQASEVLDFFEKDNIIDDSPMEEQLYELFDEEGGDGRNEWPKIRKDFCGGNTDIDSLVSGVSNQRSARGIKSILRWADKIFKSNESKASEDFIPEPYDKHFEWVARMDQDDYHCNHCGQQMAWNHPKFGRMPLHTASVDEIVKVVKAHLSGHGITESKASEAGSWDSWRCHNCGEIIPKGQAGKHKDETGHSDITKFKEGDPNDFITYESKASESFDMHTDAGHGWLEVPKSLLKELGIGKDISMSSYQKGNNVFIEEDGDFVTFKRAYEEKYGSLSINELPQTDDESPIRDYYPYSGEAKDDIVDRMLNQTNYENDWKIDEEANEYSIFNDPTYKQSMNDSLGLKSVDSHYKSDGITCSVCGETPSDKREHLRKHYGIYFDESVALESKAKEELKGKESFRVVIDNVIEPHTFHDRESAQGYLDDVKAEFKVKDPYYNGKYEIIEESKASEYLVQEEFDLQDQDGKYEILSKADLSVTDATKYSTYSHDELPEEVKDSLKGDEDSFGESWNQKSSINRIESLESVGIKQGDAIKLSGLEFEDFGEDLQGALKGDVEDARTQMKQDKHELDGLGDYNPNDSEDAKTTGLGWQEGGEVDNPNSEFDQNYPDYNNIGKSQTNMTNYECEFCDNGFESNESLSIHHNDKHAIAPESLDGYATEKKGSCKTCGMQFTEEDYKNAEDGEPSPVGDYDDECYNCQLGASEADPDFQNDPDFQGYASETISDYERERRRLNYEEELTEEEKSIKASYFNKLHNDSLDRKNKQFMEDEQVFGEPEEMYGMLGMESKASESVTIDDFKRIKDNLLAEKLNFEQGSALVDIQTANAIVAVWDNINEEQRLKFPLHLTSAHNVARLAGIAFKSSESKASERLARDGEQTYTGYWGHPKDTVPQTGNCPNCGHDVGQHSGANTGDNICYGGGNCDCGFTFPYIKESKASESDLVDGIIRVENGEMGDDELIEFVLEHRDTLMQLQGSWQRIVQSVDDYNFSLSDESKASEDDPDFDNDADFEGKIDGVSVEPSQYTQSGMDHTDYGRGDIDESKASENSASLKHHIQIENGHYTLRMFDQYGNMKKQMYYRDEQEARDMENSFWERGNNGSSFNVTLEKDDVDISSGNESKSSEVCPECNSSKVHINRDKGDSRFGQGKYACNNCGNTFGGESKASEGLIDNIWGLLIDSSRMQFLDEYMGDMNASLMITMGAMSMPQTNEELADALGVSKSEALKFISQWAYDNGITDQIYTESKATEAGSEDHICAECGFVTSDNSEYIDHLHAHEE